MRSCGMGDDTRMSWDELGRRAEQVRDLFTKHRVPLVPGEGLDRVLLEAEVLAKGAPAKIELLPEEYRVILNDAHVIYSLAENLDACVQSGVDVKIHLKQIRTGTTDYGTAAGENGQKTIFFKDFEYELCVCAAALRSGLRARFSDEPNDPHGDLHVESLRVEVKHPNSVRGLQKLVRKFNSGLYDEGAYGVFVTGLEDAFALGAPGAFATPADLEAHLAKKRAEMESFGREFIRYVASLSHVLAIVQTTTMLEIVAGASCLTRSANALIFDGVRPQAPASAMDDALRVASVFNPAPVRYSAVRERPDPTPE